MPRRTISVIWSRVSSSRWLYPRPLSAATVAVRMPEPPSSCRRRRRRPWSSATGTADGTMDAAVDLWRTRSAFSVGAVTAHSVRGWPGDGILPEVPPASSRTNQWPARPPRPRRRLSLRRCLDARGAAGPRRHRRRSPFRSLHRPRSLGRLRRRAPNRRSIAPASSFPPRSHRHLLHAPRRPSRTRLARALIGSYQDPLQDWKTTAPPLSSFSTGPFPVVLFQGHPENVLALHGVSSVALRLQHRSRTRAPTAPGGRGVTGSDPPVSPLGAARQALPFPALFQGRREGVAPVRDDPCGKARRAALGGHRAPGSSDPSAVEASSARSQEPARPGH